MVRKWWNWQKLSLEYIVQLMLKLHLIIHWKNQKHTNTIVSKTDGCAEAYVINSNVKLTLHLVLILNSLLEIFFTKELV